MPRKILIVTLLLIALLATPLQAQELTFSTEYQHEATGSWAGTLGIKWQVPEADRNQQITVQVDADSAFKVEPKTISTAGRTSGQIMIPIHWADGNNRHQGVPDGSSFNVTVSDGVNQRTDAFTVGGTSTSPGTQQPQQEQRITQDQEEGGWVDKMLAAPINGAVKALRALGLKDLDTLLFNKGVEDYFIPPFIGQGAWENVKQWFNVFYYASFGLVFLGLFYTGAKIAFMAYTPKKREEAMRGLSRFLYAFVIIVAAPLMIQVFLGINNAAVDMIAGVAGDMGVLEQFRADGEGAGGSFITNLYTGHILTTAIVRIALVSLMIYFNILYLIRALVLAGLMALTPILIWLWAITGNETAIKIWFGEITSVTFMQFLHAFSLLFFISFTSVLNLWWATIVALFMVIPFTNVLRNLFQGFLRFLGINEEGIAAGGLGMIGGLAAMGKATMNPGAGISKNNTYSPSAGSSSVSLSGGGGSGGPFGVINAPMSPQAQGSLVTLSRLSPAISKVGGVIGTGVGMAMATPFIGVNPGLASTVGNIGSNITQGAIGLTGRGLALGGMTAGNMLKTGSVSEGLQKTATIQTPIDPDKYEGYAGMTHETQKPESSSHAALGLVGATLNPHTAQGYEQGQNIHRAVSTGMANATKIGNKIADPMLNPNTAQGYEQGQNIHRVVSTGMANATKIGDKVADPMQWRT